MSITKSGSAGAEYFRQTYTQLAREADDFFAKVSLDLSKEYSWVKISKSIPVFFNNELHYTVTITAASFT